MSPDTSNAAPGIELNVSSATPSRRRVIATGSVAVLGAMGLAACGSDDTATTTTPSAGGDGATAGSSSGGSGAAGDTVVALSAVPVGGGVAAAVGGQKLVVAQPTKGTVVAYSSVCPHQGCTVAPSDTQFVCPCHKSTFTFADGSVTGGPAASGLKKVAVTVDGENVVLG